MWDEENCGGLKNPKYKKKDIDERRAKNLVSGTPLNPLRQDVRIRSSYPTLTRTDLNKCQDSRHPRMDPALSRGLAHALALFLFVHRDSGRGVRGVWNEVLYRGLTGWGVGDDVAGEPRWSLMTYAQHQDLGSFEVLKSPPCSPARSLRLLNSSTT
ncbi:hypothetical protein BS17DRAFT_436621 [Gyrodon lividus]|nr:hypothetical protein BS17DRAFT_436621 [Gyrodon lividus]